MGNRSYDCCRATRALGSMSVAPEVVAEHDDWRWIQCTMKKTEVLELIRALPDDDDVDIDELIYALCVRREVDRGLADVDEGRVVSLEEIDRMIDEWPE